MHDLKHGADGAGKPKLHCVVYRFGGYARWEWRQTDACTLEVASERLREVRQMGYHAYLAVAERVRVFGLPPTFDVDETKYGKIDRHGK